jgi:hypothetical protein
MYPSLTYQVDALKTTDMRQKVSTTSGTKVCHAQRSPTTDSTLPISTAPHTPISQLSIGIECWDPVPFDASCGRAENVCAAKTGGFCGRVRGMTSSSSSACKLSSRRETISVMIAQDALVAQSDTPYPRAGYGSLDDSVCVEDILCRCEAEVDDAQGGDDTVKCDEHMVRTCTLCVAESHTQSTQSRLAVVRAQESRSPRAACRANSSRSR